MKVRYLERKENTKYLARNQKDRNGGNEENGLFKRRESGSDRGVDQTKINIWERNENIKYCKLNGNGL